MYNISGKETVTLNKLQTVLYDTSLQSTTNKTNNFTSCSSLTNNDERKDCVLKHVSWNLYKLFEKYFSETKKKCT